MSVWSGGETNKLVRSCVHTVVILRVTYLSGAFISHKMVFWSVLGLLGVLGHYGPVRYLGRPTETT